MSDISDNIHQRSSASFAKVKQNLQGIEASLKEVREKVIKLQAELEQSQLDASRYRHLRKGLGFQMSVPNGFNDEGKPRFVHYTFAHKREEEYGNTLDVTVDREIQQEKDVANRLQESKVEV